MSKKVVTIGYLKAFTSGILSIKTSDYGDTYCPTYSEITGGTIFDNWSQGANIKDSTNGIYVDGFSVDTTHDHYTSKMLVVRADLKMKYISLEALSASRSANNLSCCGASVNVDSTASFAIWTKSEDGTSSSSTLATDSSVQFTSVSNKAFATVDNTSALTTHTIAFAKNSTNFNGSVAARSATITNSYTYSGVTKTANVSIAQNSNTYGVSGRSMSVTPSSWTNVAPSGGSKSFTASISFVQYDECDSRTITSSVTPSVSSSVAWATTGSNATVTIAAQSQGAASRSGTLTFSFAVPSTYPSVGTISKTASISQQDNSVISTAYSVSNATASAPSCTESTATINYTGVTTYTYRDGSTSSSSAALTVTSSSFGTNNSCSTRSVTVSANTSPYGLVNAGTKTQGANYTTATAYTVSNAHCSPSNVEYNTTATTLYWNGTTKYTYAVEPTSCSTGGTSEYSTAYTFYQNTGTTSRTLTATTTWHEQSVSAKFTQGTSGVASYSYTVYSNENGATVSIGSLGSGTITNGSFTLTSETNAAQTVTISSPNVPREENISYTLAVPSSNIPNMFQQEYPMKIKTVTSTWILINGVRYDTPLAYRNDSTENYEVYIYSRKDFDDWTWDGDESATSKTGTVQPNDSVTLNSYNRIERVGHASITATTQTSFVSPTSVTIPTSSGYKTFDFEENSTTSVRNATFTITQTNAGTSASQNTEVLIIPQEGANMPPALDYQFCVKSSQNNDRSLTNVSKLGGYSNTGTGSTNVCGDSPNDFSVTYTAGTSDTDVRVTMTFTMTNSVSVTSLSNVKINSALIAASGVVGTQYQDGNGSFITVNSGSVELIAPLSTYRTSFDCTLNLSNGTSTSILDFNGLLYGIV